MRNIRKGAFAAWGVLSACFLARPSAAVDQQDFSQIERGRYLAIVADCAACHTRPGGPYLAGGRPIETPFGTIVSPNITPDEKTGIGAWEAKDFLAALKTGMGRGGTRLYPAMPYVYYTKMPDADVLAIWAYIRTLPPVRNPVVSNQLPFPFNIRFSMLFWNWLYFKKGDWKPDGSKSAEWNRGAYLVEGPMHCGACHTPKTLLGGDAGNRVLQGYSIQGWHAPNITNDDRLGIGSWPADQIAEYLQTGHNKTASAAGPMAEEVERSSQRISAADLSAVAAYLKDRAAPPSDKTSSPIAASDPVMKAGQAIYGDSCAACHSEDGRGVPEMFPALRADPAVRAGDPLSLIRAVLDGAKSAAAERAPTGPGMPSYAWQLSDEQIAAVLTYVRNAWGNAAGAVSRADVQSARATLKKQPD